MCLVACCAKAVGQLFNSLPLLKNTASTRVNGSRNGQELDAATGHALVTAAVGETVILLHPPPPSVDVSIAMKRERQQNDSLADGVGDGCRGLCHCSDGGAPPSRRGEMLVMMMMVLFCLSKRTPLLTHFPVGKNQRWNTLSDMLVHVFCGSCCCRCGCSLRLVVASQFLPAQNIKA